MKRFCHILSGLVALGAAVSVQAMSLGLRMTLWNRSAREAPSYPVGETLAADAQSASLTWTVGTNGVASVKGYDDATATGGKSVKFTAADNASVWIEGVVSKTELVGVKAVGVANEQAVLFVRKRVDLLALAAEHRADGAREAGKLAEVEANIVF